MRTQKLFLVPTSNANVKKSPKVIYRRWSVLKRQIQFNKVHSGRIYILLLQKYDHNDQLQKYDHNEVVESNVDEKTGGRTSDGHSGMSKKIIF